MRRHPTRQMEDIAALAEEMKSIQRYLLFLIVLFLLGCTHQVSSEPNSKPSSRDTVQPDANTISLIQRYYVDEGARKGLIALPKRKVFEQLLVALRSNNPKIVHNSTTLLRDQYGTAEACQRIRVLLARLLAHPDDKTLFTRMVCCEILAKYPDENSIPVLMLALDDPGMHHSMTPAPGGTAEHIYRSVWVEALQALESIAGEDVSSFTGREGLEFGSTGEKWIREAKEWWKQKNEESSNKPDAGDGK